MEGLVRVRLETAPTNYRKIEELNRLTLPVEPFDGEMEQIFHDFIVNLHVFFCLIFQARDDV